MKNDVTFQRSEVEEHRPDWDKVDDVTAGERAVKDKTITYLPKPNPTDASNENSERYNQYVDRAVFVNFTGRTSEGMIGIAFKRGPEIEVPLSMDFVNSDIDGAGGGISNQSRRVLEALLKNGRRGLLADFPIGNGAISKAQQTKLNIHATIVDYPAKSIINWRLDEQQNLILLVLHEMVDEPDGFAVETVEQWRELAMGTRSDEDETANVRYVVRVWRMDDKTGEPVIVEQFVPKDAGGNEMSFIPFAFLGAVDNNTEIDKAPLLDLACLNIAHYRNSADYEESAFFMGQPWFVMAGLTEHWADKYFKDGAFVGSRAATLLPEGGSAQILQAEANILAGAAMQAKETQAVALGARLLTHGEAIKTAEQSRSETAAAHSVLSLAATNMAAGYTQVLEWVALFTSGATGPVSYTMPDDYTGLNADPILLSAIVAAWQSGAISTPDKNSAMRQIGMIDPEKDDQQIAEEVELDGGGLELDE